FTTGMLNPAKLCDAVIPCPSAQVRTVVTAMSVMAIDPALPWTVNEIGWPCEVVPAKVRTAAVAEVVAPSTATETSATTNATVSFDRRTRGTRIATPPLARTDGVCDRRHRSVDGANGAAAVS